MAIAFDVENSRPKHHFNTEFISNRIYSILHVFKQKPRRFRNARGLMPRSPEYLGGGFKNNQPA